MPVIEHYERQGKLAKISAVPPPEEASTFLTDAPVTCVSGASLAGEGLSITLHTGSVWSLIHCRPLQ